MAVVSTTLTEPDRHNHRLLPVNNIFPDDYFMPLVNTRERSRLEGCNINHYAALQYIENCLYSDL